MHVHTGAATTRPSAPTGFTPSQLCMDIAQREANSAISMHSWLGVNPVGADGRVVAGRLAGLALVPLGDTW